MVGRLALIAVAAAACTTTFKGEVRQPNPLANQNETLRVTEKVTIVTSQMGLDVPRDVDASSVTGSLNSGVMHSKHWPFVNQASFTVVSRDRLRFHVQVDHTWEDWADLATWQVDLQDDQGRHYGPEALEHARKKVITKMWDNEKRSAVCNGLGRTGTGDCVQTMGYKEDGFRDRQMMGNISVFRGMGDFVFYQRDLFTPHVRWMRLTLHRPGQSFEFLWEFEDTVAAN